MNTKSSLFILVLLLIATSIRCQSKEEINKILTGGEKVPQVLLIGSFHFGYPGLDAHVTDDKYKLDILSPQRQKEVKELVAYIARFKPTKIMVERKGNTGYLMHRLREWKKGNDQLHKSETDQVALRLVDQFQLDTIYGIDANSWSRSISRSKDSTQIAPILNGIYSSQPDSLYENAFDDRYDEWYEEMDRRTVQMNLLDYFKDMNTEHQIKMMHGNYILKNKTKAYNDVDGLAMNWYTRNLRIFKNIQMVETNSEDRIMVLIGAGHAAILRHLFESTPEYELVDFNDL